MKLVKYDIRVYALYPIPATAQFSTDVILKTEMLRNVMFGNPNLAAENLISERISGS